MRNQYNREADWRLPEAGKHTPEELAAAWREVLAAEKYLRGEAGRVARRMWAVDYARACEIAQGIALRAALEAEKEGIVPQRSIRAKINLRLRACVFSDCRPALPLSATDAHAAPFDDGAPISPRLKWIIEKIEEIQASTTISGQAFQLRLAGASYQEIAEAFSCTRSAARNYCDRTLASLRRHAARAFPGDFPEKPIDIKAAMRDRRYKAARKARATEGSNA